MPFLLHTSYFLEGLYRSLSALGFHEAAEQCKSQSGGHLAAFEENDEFDQLKQFLQHHVVENIRKSRFICTRISRFAGFISAMLL